MNASNTSAMLGSILALAIVSACASKDATTQAFTPQNLENDGSVATTTTANGNGKTCTPGGDGSYVNEPYAKLSDYCLVSIHAESAPPHIDIGVGAVGYDVQNALFTDYALKVRAVWIPPNAGRARYDATRAFEFPVGTIVSKTFGYTTATPSRAPRWIETRLLVRTSSGWHGYAYVWDDAHVDAVLKPGGAIVDVGAIVDTAGASRLVTHLVPNQNQCKKCHGDGDAIVPIGLRVEQLNRSVTFSRDQSADGPAVAEEQLTRWMRLGILEGAPAPADAPRAPAWNDPTTGSPSERARAYLDANCAHCHNPTGAARTTGLLLGRHVTDAYAFGACKSPVAAGKATGDLSYDIVPGEPERSILVHRMRSTEPSVMMPEIGRSLVHDEAISLVSEWIKALPGSCRD